MKGNETTLAAANVEIVHDKIRNLDRFVEFIEEAALQGADLLVLPELGLQGYADFAFGLGTPGSAEQKQYYLREAEPIPGPATDHIQKYAERHNMYIQIGLAESALSGSAIFNSTALVGPEGVVGVHRKLHNQFEAAYFNPGNAASVFDTSLGRVGSLICYDLVFPEHMRLYALQGAQLALLSTGWPMRGHDREDDYYGWWMDMSAQANAAFNQMWLVVSNHCEKDVYSDHLDYYGGSQIVDPWGKVVAKVEGDEGLAVHTADLQADIVSARTDGLCGHNLLAHRRPEHYGLLADTSYYHPGPFTVGGSEAATQ